MPDPFGRRKAEDQPIEIVGFGSLRGPVELGTSILRTDRLIDGVSVLPDSARMDTRSMKTAGLL